MASIKIFSSLFFLTIILLSWHACTYDTLEAPNDCSNPPSLTIISTVNSNCGIANGEIEVIGIGGVGTFEYSIDEQTFQQDGIFTNLAAGAFTITVRDGNGCTNEETVTIQNSDGLNIQVNTAPAGCGTPAGQIEILAQDNQGDVQFKIDQGSFQAGNVFDQLPIGKYQVTARDASGCEVQQEVQLTSGVVLADIKSIVETNCALSNCHGGTISPDLRNESTILSRASRIRVRTSGKTMPPPSSGLSLDDSEIQAISCWVEDGTP